MTNDYDLVLPLMLCSIIASVTERLLDKDSIYTARMREAGHDVLEGLEELAIHRNYVRDIMRASFNAVPETAPLDEILELFNKSREGTIYVVKENGELGGLIALGLLSDPLHQVRVQPTQTIPVFGRQRQHVTVSEAVGVQNAGIPGPALALVGDHPGLDPRRPQPLGKVLVGGGNADPGIDHEQRQISLLQRLLGLLLR